jgi:hypothetical protein
MNRNSLLTLARYAIASATTESDELAIYECLADAAGPDCAQIRSIAEQCAGAIRARSEMRERFRDLIQGQLPLSSTPTQPNP